tara:strand:+ start:855 stop:992 length:138 start_codon:yes stop_codon:yes gene_type:complete
MASKDIAAMIMVDSKAKTLDIVIERDLCQKIMTKHIEPVKYNYQK